MKTYPSTWLLKPISEVFEINPRSFCAITSATDLPVHFVPMKAVVENFGGINVDDIQPLSRVIRGYTAFLEGDVIFAKITPCMENGKIAVIPNLKHHIGYGSTEFHVLKGTGLSYPYWLAYYLSQRSIRLLAKRNMTGSAGQLRVPVEWFSTCEIPIPPLPEQHRILSELRGLLSKLDEAIGRLERIKSNLKRYRASVLQAAVKGRLTAGWRKQNPPSETGAELLARILEERRAKWEENQLKKYAEQGRTPPKNWKEKYPEPVKPDITELPELPEGWVWATVNQLAAPETNAITDGPFGSNLKSEHYTGSGPRVIRLQNIKDGYFEDMYSHISGEHFERLIKHEIKAGDIAIASLGENPPRACIIPEYVGPAIVKADCISFKPHPCLSVEYLNYTLNCLATRKRVKQILHGIGRPRLSLGEIREIVLPIPPCSEQIAIEELVESRLSLAESAGKTMDSALQRAARLRQSILKRAFEGRLVPQDPNDEPASALLERIRAERDKQAATVKPARAKSKVKDRQADTSTGEIGTQGAETA